jgi:predicted DNA-binding protein YlxM (UPF0122 family)
MEDRIYYTNLFDYYGELLTDIQKNYFEDYYFNNLTLSEMSENYNVSRNAVSKQLKGVINKLDYYEEKLNLYNKSKKIKEIIKDIDKEKQNKIIDLI